MAIVTYSRAAGMGPTGSLGLTPEEIKMLAEAEKLPQVYDDDCPKLTPDQLAEFQPVYYASMEERRQVMRGAVSGLHSRTSEIPMAVGK